MKKFNGLKKISVKVNSHDVGIYKALTETMPGSKKVIIEPGLIAYVLPNGTILELYNEGAAYPAYLFSVSNQVINYKVDDLDLSLASMEKAGARLLSEVEEVCSSYRYCHLKISESHIIGIFEER